MKRDILDAVVSDLVREIWDWTCCRCHREFPDRKGRDVHASHFYSRAYNATRWHIENLFCLCAKCHDFVSKNPDEHVAMVKRELGDTRYEALRERKKRIYRYRKSDKQEMAKHYRAQLVDLKRRRSEGERGYLPVAAWD